MNWVKFGCHFWDSSGVVPCENPPILCTNDACESSYMGDGLSSKDVVAIDPHSWKGPLNKAPLTATVYTSVLAFCIKYNGYSDLRIIPEKKCLACCIHVFCTLFGNFHVFIWYKIANCAISYYMHKKLCTCLHIACRICPNGVQRVSDKFWSFEAVLLFVWFLHKH